LIRCSGGHVLARAQALTTVFAFLEPRHQVEIHTMTGRVVACPIDEMNKPCGPLADARRASRYARRSFRR
jgi:hypothetical protein